MQGDERPLLGFGHAHAELERLPLQGAQGDERPPAGVRGVPEKLSFLLPPAAALEEKNLHAGLVTNQIKRGKYGSYIKITE